MQSGFDYPVCRIGGASESEARTCTVIIIGQEETTTTSDTSTATLLYPTTASELCINGYVTCGRKITWGPGLRACKGPLIRGRHGPTTARSPARKRHPGDEKLRR